MLQRFLEIVRNRDIPKLASWLDDATSSTITERESFVAGIKRDRLAVEAALSLPWSQGVVEGQVNRLKMLKRMMFGKAGFDLLRLRMLYRASSYLLASYSLLAFSPSLVSPFLASSDVL